MLQIYMLISYTVAHLDAHLHIRTVHISTLIYQQHLHSCDYGVSVSTQHIVHILHTTHLYVN